MIRHVRPGQTELARQLSGIGGPLQQSHKKARTGRVRHRPTQPVHHVQTRSNSQHMLNNTATAEPLARWALPHERRLVARTPYFGGGAERPGSATPSIRSSDVAGMTAKIGRE